VVVVLVVVLTVVVAEWLLQEPLVLLIVPRRAMGHGRFVLGELVEKLGQIVLVEKPGQIVLLEGFVDSSPIGSFERRELLVKLERTRVIVGLDTVAMMDVQQPWVLEEGREMFRRNDCPREVLYMIACYWRKLVEVRMGRAVDLLKQRSEDEQTARKQAEAHTWTKIR
jgi:hypothetical protein